MIGILIVAAAAAAAAVVALVFDFHELAAGVGRRIAGAAGASAGDASGGSERIGGTGN